MDFSNIQGKEEREILTFCRHVMSMSSTNDKKSYVASFCNNDNIKNFLSWLLDKLIVTGISTKKLTKDVSKAEFPLYIPHSINEVMIYLRDHNTGSDKDIVAVQGYFKWIASYITDEEDIKILQKIVTKSLRLGIDTKLVNKAIPGLIHVHEVQQANSLKDTNLKEGEWICLSEKLNGNRATYIDGKLYSRQGKVFEGVDHIIKELNRLRSMFDVNMVFDGEIRRKNVEGLPDNENFTIGTGLLNSDAEDKTALSFIIFDILPKSEFDVGESNLTYKQRYELMKYVESKINVLSLPYNHVEVVPFLYAGNDHTMIQECLNKMDAEGKEGCMLARDVTYKCKRHSGLLKVKTFYTMDLPIVGFQTGTGKNENTLGNVIVQYKDNTVGVGSGFTDEERQWFWEHQDELIGRVIEVKYKDITKDKGTGKESLQFPTFVQLREVGKETSYA